LSSGDLTWGNAATPAQGKGRPGRPIVNARYAKRHADQPSRVQIHFLLQLRTYASGRRKDQEVTSQTERTRIQRLRRMAKRQRLEISKSRRRDPRAYDYDTWSVLDHHGYPIEGQAELDLDGVERYLTR